MPWANASAARGDDDMVAALLQSTKTLHAVGQSHMAEGLRMG